MPIAAGSLRERGKQSRRERILESARALLRERPERTFTLPELADRAEVSIPTITNLIGNRDAIWAALADSAVATIDFGELPADPYPRVRGIIDSIVATLVTDVAVHRALIRDWNDGLHAMTTNPTREFVACFRAARDAGDLAPSAEPRRLARAMTAGLVGSLQQWGVGVLDNAAVRAQLRDIVDITFAAGRWAGGS
ncbi:hypothetical protein MMOR_10060 [Mycolicibacterium moriokaense]|uniref:HTH tetR-type domain-containing protein n=1 Tax=Mycolicibacterium moriokaense TaxID=39691 RepID=A0AAD1H7G5_9MYCO|nr:hypothetical protein MMOR_10060 [Mycolicibacterium moriokaense]